MTYPDFRSLRVLVADDHSHSRSIMRAILGGIGIHRVEQCEDGASAFEVLGGWDADLAIIDYQMSPVDGVEFTYLLRNSSDSPNRYLPVIMATAYADRQRVCEARDAGVTEIMVKPVTASAVIDRLNAVIFHPRPYVQSEAYFGPCRRRRQAPSFQGPWRRASDYPHRT